MRRFEEAIARSNTVADAWRHWVEAFEAANELQPALWDRIRMPFRVRTWGLKQQMRDAALAPLVRWVCANEGKIDPERLRFIEHMMAGVAVINRENIEEKLTDRVGVAFRKPRADALRAADVPRLTDPIPPQANSNAKIHIFL